VQVIPTREAVRRHQDHLVAGVMLVLGEAQVVAGADGAGRPAVAVPAVLVLSAALVLRRRRTLAVTATVATVWLVCALLDAPQSSIWGLVLVLVISYSAAAHADARAGLIGLTLLLAATYASTWLTPGSELGDRLFTAPVLVGGPWAAGLLARRFREQAHVLTVVNAELEERRSHDVAEATLRERTRIARELHDVVSHGLGMITVQAAAALRVLDVDPRQARGPLQEIRDQGKEALADMRTMLDLLADDEKVAPRRGLEDVPALLPRLRAAGIDTSYVAGRGTAESLTEEQGLVVYRVVQESITNALKHGTARRLSVRVRAGDGFVDVVVEDDGAPARSGNGSGLGLAGMRARAAQVGGEVHAGRRAEGGWHVVLRLPLQDSAEGRGAERRAAVPEP
jgi:signal transduction histidine kinase